MKLEIAAVMTPDAAGPARASACVGPQHGATHIEDETGTQTPLIGEFTPEVTGPLTDKG